MATTPIEFDLSGASGLTLTADVHAPLSDTLLASAKTCTEQTNRKGVYRFDMTENVTGLNIVRVKNGSITIASFPINPALADDTTLYEASDRFADVKQWSGTAIPGVDTAGYPKVTIKDGTGQGEILTTTGKVDGVILADTVTNYTGNTVQTGDSYARIGATGSGLSSLAPSATALSTATWTGTRAGYLDNLSAGAVATSAEVTSIQNNTRVVRVVPTVIERPDSGTTTYRIELLIYDAVGNMEAPDSAPTIALVDQGGTDLSARLDSATMALVSTGRYRAVYTASSTDDLEQLVWAFSVLEGSQTRIYGNTTIIVDTTAVDFTSSDRTLLQAAATQASVDDLPTNAELAAALAAADDAVLAAITALNNLDAAGVLDAADGVETGITLRQAQRIILAALAGKVSGADTNAPIFRSATDAKNRITATTDADGNRTAVTLDAT